MPPRWITGAHLPVTAHSLVRAVQQSVRYEMRHILQGQGAKNGLVDTNQWAQMVLVVRPHGPESLSSGQPQKRQLVY